MGDLDLPIASAQDLPVRESVNGQSIRRSARLTDYSMVSV